MSGELSYCGQLVREQDADRFLLAQFAYAEHREALYALFAFNHEIAKTREVVSETRLGLIRLQWWRDAIAEIFEGETVREHRVVEALAEVVRVYDLEREPFDSLIYAREFDLEDVLPSDLEGFLNYAAYTHSPLMDLVTCVLDAGNDPVQPIAVNYALIGILRATLSFAKQRRCYLPQDLLTERGVYLNQLYDLKLQDGLPTVIEAVADSFVEGVQCENRFLKAMNRLSILYYKQLKRCGYDVFHPRMVLPPAFKEIRLFLNW